MARYGTLETHDLEDQETLSELTDGESVLDEGPFDGEGWDGEGSFDHEGWDGEGMTEGAAHDMETYLLGEAGAGDFEDFEADPFIGDIVRRAKRTVRKVVRGGVGPGLLKQLAQQAAGVAGGAIAGPTGARIASQIANQVIRESDYEGDFEGDLEGDFEALGGDHEILEEMDYYAAMAAETDNEAEADQFLGAIANLAAPLIGSLLGGDGETADPFLGDVVGSLLGEQEGDYYEGERDEFLPALAALAPMAAPLMGKAIKGIGSLFRGSPATRPAVRAIPRIVANAGSRIARAARAGRRVTPQRIAQSVAQQTARTLASRPRLARTIRANRAAAARAQGRPAMAASPAGLAGARPASMNGAANGALRYPGAARAGTHRGPAGVYGSPRRGRPRLVGYVPVYAPRRRPAYR